MFKTSFFFTLSFNPSGLKCYHKLFKLHSFKCNCKKKAGHTYFKITNIYLYCYWSSCYPDGHFLVGSFKSLPCLSYIFLFLLKLHQNASLAIVDICKCPTMSERVSRTHHVGAVLPTAAPASRPRDNNSHL